MFPMGNQTKEAEAEVDIVTPQHVIHAVADPI